MRNIGFASEADPAHPVIFLHRNKKFILQECCGKNWRSLVATGVLDCLKDGFDYSVSCGAWAVGGVKNTLQSTIGDVIRSSLFFPDPLNKFSPAHFEECRNVLNPEIADPIHYPRKKRNAAAFHTRRKNNRIYVG